MLRKSFLLFCTAAIAACASVDSHQPARPADATDYTAIEVAPAETEHFVQTDSKIFDEPMLGVLYDYANKQYPSDNLDLFVYPINHFDWGDTESLLEQEMQRVLAEIDRATELGYYRSRGAEQVDPHTVASADGQLEGLKASFEFETNNGGRYFSNVYLFVEGDKFIKVRSSFDSEATVPWDGDEFVREVLPKLQVPGESAHLKKLRAAHRQQLKDNLMRVFLQAAMEQQGSTDGIEAADEAGEAAQAPESATGAGMESTEE